MHAHTRNANRRYRNGSSLPDRKQRIYDFLLDNPIGVLSSVTPDGNPHESVIYQRINPDMTISFLTRTATRKYDNIKHHNHVCLTVFEPASQTTAQVIGIAEEITDNYQINAIAGSVLGISLRVSKGSMPPIAKLEVGDYTAFRILPVQIRIATFAMSEGGGYGDLFDSVESFELSEDAG